jgi:hypothetical protein
MTGVEAAWQEFPNVELALNQMDDPSGFDLFLEKISQVYLEGTPNPIVLEFMFGNNVWIAFSISFMHPNGRYFINPIAFKLLTSRVFFN